MSGVEDRVRSLNEKETQDRIFATQKARIMKRREIEAGQSAALFFAAMAYGDTMQENRAFRLMSHWGKLFCIAAAFVIPNLLMFYVVF